jgi:RsmE family RNA methyltransferase
MRSSAADGSSARVMDRPTTRKSAPADFATVAALAGAALADRAGPPPTLEHSTILVGPEGGWTEEERAVGLPSVGLSAAVLRAETASITAGALLAARRDLTT